MGLFNAIKAMIKYKKLLKTTRIVRFADDDAYSVYSFACCYKAQESVSRYYCAFNPHITFDDAMELIRYSKELRDTVAEAMLERILHAKPEEFDFTVDVNSIQIFPEFEDEDHRIHIARIYSDEYGIRLMELLSVRAEQAFYLYLRKEKGYTKEWKDFLSDLVTITGFGEPAYTALKSWISNITFPNSVWGKRKIIGLMNEGKQRIDLYGRQA